MLVARIHPTMKLPKTDNVTLVAKKFRLKSKNYSFKITISAIV